MKKRNQPNGSVGRGYKPKSKVSEEIAIKKSNRQNEGFCKAIGKASPSRESIK
jgi:hypothetical protein